MLIENKARRIHMQLIYPVLNQVGNGLDKLSGYYWTLRQQPNLAVPKCDRVYVNIG